MAYDALQLVRRCHALQIFTSFIYLVTYLLNCDIFSRNFYKIFDIQLTTKQISDIL